MLKQLKISIQQTTSPRIYKTIELHFFIYLNEEINNSHRSK